MGDGQLRICVPRMDIGYSLTQDGKAVGFAAFIISAQLDLYTASSLNHSFVWEDSMGSQEDPGKMLYNGCLGSVQRNQSDVLTALLTMPVIGPNLTQTIVDGSQRMTIMSAYKKASLAHDTHRTSVLDMFAGVSSDVWLVACQFLVMLLLTMAIRLRFARSFQRNSLGLSFKAITACILKQCCVSLPRVASVKMIFTLTVLMTFYLSFFVSSMIKTDMVVVRPPLTISTYEQLMQSGRRPTWHALTSDMRAYQEATAGSLEWRVWQHAISMGLKDSLIQSSKEAIMKAAVRGFGMKDAFLASELMGMSAFASACSAKHIAESADQGAV